MSNMPKVNSKVISRALNRAKISQEIRKIRFFELIEEYFSNIFDMKYTNLFGDNFLSQSIIFPVQ